MRQGPGDSPSPGDADTTPGEDSDAAPAASPGDDQAPEGAEPGKDAGAPPAEETAEPKEPHLTPSQRRRPRSPRASPRSKLPRTKTTMGLKGKRKSRPPPPRTMANDKEAEAPAESKEADAESAAAAAKVEVRRHSAPTDPVALAAFQALETNCARCHQAGAIAEAREASQEFRQHPASRRDRSGARTDPARQSGRLQALHPDRQAGDALRLLPGVQLREGAERERGQGDLRLDQEPRRRSSLPPATDRKPIDEEAIVTAIADDLDAAAGASAARACATSR